MNIRCIIIKLIPFFLLPFVASGQHDYTNFVNPFIGTGGHGHTYPGATMPFGMVQLSPDTRNDLSWDGCGGYHYSDSVIYGFSHTHLSGTGVPDLCDILIMPVSGTITPARLEKQTVTSRFLHGSEQASPGYYSVHLQDGNIDAEMTVTPRTGMHKYIFNKKDSTANLILDLVHRDRLMNGTVFRISNTRVAGFRQSQGWAHNQVLSFVIDFSEPFESCISSGGAALVSREPVSGTSTRLCFRFRNNGPIYVKVALSPVTVDGAIRNMEAENPGWDFEKIRKLAHDAWQHELGKIEVTGGSDEELHNFYTALYHCMIVPNLAMNTDSSYHGRDFLAHKTNGSNYYSVFSLWDTFRAWHPLMTIIDRKRTAEFINTFLLQYEQGRMLPVWELASNETNCMIGYHSVSVIADAAVKGIKGFDRKLALKAMKNSAEAEYRFGLDAYMDHGFIGVEDESESVSKTLEYAYDDWCIAQMAHLTGNKQDEKKYLQRSQYWKNIFDPEVGFARPRLNGNWISPFDPKEVSNHFTEANSWQYTFFVPQDVNGLIVKTGGPQRFEEKLDALFAADSRTTGREQADITGLIGQYAQGNEPSHHIVYLYNYIGRPEKTQQLVNRIMHEMYHNAPDGLIGNEDCGQMSAWYVLSAMGFYSVTPGLPEFQLGIPLFTSVKIHLENGKTFTVTSESRKDTSAALEAYVSGNTFPAKVIRYDDIMLGKTLAFRNPAGPPKKFIFTAAKDTFITVPLIEASSIFRENTMVTLRSDQKNVKFYYTYDPQDSIISKLYNGPFRVDSSVTVRACAKDPQGRKSLASSAVLHKMPHPSWKITLNTTYNKQYSAGGPEGLIDGIRGDTEWRKGYWQGYQGQSVEAVIDMGVITTINNVSAGFLQDTRSWILMPKRVTFSFSADGLSYSDSVTVENTIPDQDFLEQVNELSAALKTGVNARFVKMVAINYGKLPEWHPGAGYEAFIFTDEIEVK